MFRPFLGFLQNGEPKERAAAANSLPVLELGDSRNVAIRLLSLAAQDPDVNVRGQGIAALGELRALDAKELFLAALTDPEWAVRMFACVAVSRIEDRPAVPRLRGLLADDM